MTKVRLEVGTDSARIGIWDSSFTAMGPTSLHWNVAEERARAGDLFFVYLGGDGGGPLEVYVNEEVPSQVASKLHRSSKPYLLRVKSGKVTVGGVEDFGASKRIITGDSDDIPVPSGTYKVQCFLPVPEEPLPKPLAGSLAAIATYHASTWFRYLGCLSMLGVLACAAFVETLESAILIFAAIMAVSWLLAWILSRTAAYKSVAPKVTHRPEVDEEFLIVFHLVPADATPDLQGGFVSVS